MRNDQFNTGVWNNAKNSQRIFWSNKNLQVHEIMSEDLSDVSKHENLTCSLPLSLSLPVSRFYSLWCMPSSNCESLLLFWTSPVWLPASAPGADPGVIDGIPPDANTNPVTYTHTQVGPLNHSVTQSETSVTNASWSSVTNKNSPETDRLLCGSDLLSGVPHLPLPSL